MKIILLLSIIVFSTNVFAQGTINTYQNYCKSCHTYPEDSFSNIKTNNLNNTIQRMFLTQTNYKPSKKENDNMTEYIKSFVNKKIFVEIIQIDKNEIRGQTSNYVTIQMIKNNKIIQKRKIENNDFIFPIIKGAKTLKIIKNNKTFTIPIKKGIYTFK